jgi:hypothetical protein
MAITVKKGILWRREIENQPGTFAKALEPFARGGMNLSIVMGYTSPSSTSKGAVEVFPITDSKSEQAAKEAGLHPASEIPCLVLEGDDKPGLAYSIAKTIADSGINLHFAMCQSVEKRFQACFGFGSDSDASKASESIKKQHS